MRGKFVRLLCIIALLTGTVVLPTTQSVQAAPPVRLSLSDQKTELKFYIRNQVIGEERRIRGVANLISADIVALKELKKEDVEAFYDLRPYQRTNQPFFVSYAAINMKVRRESKYRLNGINYRIVVFVYNNATRKWQIKAYSMAPVNRIISMGIGFGTPEEKQMATIMQFHYRGRYVNRQGKVIDFDNFARNLDIWNEMKSARTSDAPVPTDIPETINPNYKRPQFIRVKMTTPENRKYWGCAGGGDCVVAVDFLEYLQHVLPYEWVRRGPEESQKAGALAIKMYAWYAVAVDPLGEGSRADVVDVHTVNQTYHAVIPREDRADEAIIKKMADIFYAPGVAGVGFKESKFHNLFPTEYREGFGSHRRGSGLISQLGADQLAGQQRLKHTEIIRFYYDNSEKTNRSPVNFYRYAK